MTFKYRYRKQILMVSLIILMIGGSLFSYFSFFKEDKKEINEKSEILLSSKKKKTKTKKVIKEVIENIMVDVKGEVVNSGIYTLKTGSRVIDAINMAGGITKNGDTSVLNLSKKLTDEMVIVVYSYYEVKNFTKTKEVEEVVNNSCVNSSDGVENGACIENDVELEESNSKKVSLNSATIDELMTLSGIGEAKAKSIIDYRDKNGGFKNIEDIKNVTGIGDSLFDKIKENITL